MIVKLKNVRLSFPDLFEARAFEPGKEPKYGATFLIPKSSPSVKEIEDAIALVAELKWGAKAKAILASIRHIPNKFCFQDGDTKPYDGYQGMMALKANRKSRPEVRDRDNSVLTVTDGRPYAGCYVNGSFELFAYPKGGNGISATLRGVQFYKDGDAFTGGAPVGDDEFEDLGVDNDETGLA